MIDIEKTLEKINDLRAKKSKLADEIAILVSEVVTYLEEKKKTSLKIGDYSVNYFEKKKRVFDFEVVEKCIAENKPIPPSAWKIEPYKRLFIETKKDMVLVGNKFLRK